MGGFSSGRTLIRGHTPGPGLRRHDPGQRLPGLHGFSGGKGEGGVWVGGLASIAGSLVIADRARGGPAGPGPGSGVFVSPGGRVTTAGLTTVFANHASTAGDERHPGGSRSGPGPGRQRASSPRADFGPRIAPVFPESRIIRPAPG